MSNEQTSKYMMSKYRHFDGITWFVIRCLLILFVVWAVFYISNSFIFNNYHFYDEMP